MELSYNLKNKQFIADGEPVSKKYAQISFENGTLSPNDCTLMILRLVNEFDWDTNRLAQFYKDNP